MVVKIYENTEANSDHTSDAVSTQRQMIGSGKKIDLGKQGEREILFIGKYNKPKNVFHQTDSIFPASATWISHNNSNIKFIIAKNEENGRHSKTKEKCCFFWVSNKLSGHEENRFYH